MPRGRSGGGRSYRAAMIGGFATRLGPSQRVEAIARISHRSHVHRGSESAKVLLQQSLAAKQRRSPMPTQCTPARFDFPRVEGRAVVAAFDGGRITSDAGALLLGATDRVIGLTR